MRWGRGRKRENPQGTQVYARLVAAEAQQHPEAPRWRSVWEKSDRHLRMKLLSYLSSQMRRAGISPLMTSPPEDLLPEAAPAPEATPTPGGLREEVAASLLIQLAQTDASPPDSAL